MTDPLLLLHIDIEIANHHDSARRPNAFLTATELSIRHVALHDVDAVFLIKGDTRDFIKTHYVVLAYQPPLTTSHVDKHLGNGCLAPGNQVGIRGDLLEDMALSRTTWAKLHQVIVPFDKRGHPEQNHHLRPFVQVIGFVSNGANKKVLPFLCRELSPAFRENIHTARPTSDPLPAAPCGEWITRRQPRCS